MKHCGKCKIEFTGELEQCPLCQAELTGEVEPSVFPYNEVKKSEVLALKVLAFATGTCLLLVLFLWYLLSLPGNIVLTVCVALVINYLFVRNILLRNPDFLRVVVRYFLILLAMAAVWFLVTQNLVITTFVIPGICLLALVFDAALVVVFKDTFVLEYTKYLLFDVMFGLTPLLLVALGLTTWNLIAYVSAFTASILLLGLLVFMRKQLLIEIRKLFST